MAELAQTVTPQGLLAVCRFVDVAAGQGSAGRRPSGGRAGQRPRPGQRRHRAAHRRRGGRGRGGVRRRVGGPLQRQVRAGLARAACSTCRWWRGPGGGRRRQRLREAGLRILAADGARPAHLDDLRRRRPGWPGRPPGCSATRHGGCPPTSLALADEAVAVPIYGRAESLNLAAAAAVCLYASARAQRAQSEAGRRGVWRDKHWYVSGNDG